MQDRWITDWEPSERFPLYTRANAGEVLPAPCTPLGWELVWAKKGVAHGWADGVERWGSFTADESSDDRPEYVACFGGYFYLNASMIRLVGVRTPGMSAEAMDAAFLGEHPDVPPYIPQEGDERPELSAEIEKTMGWIMSATEEPAELGEDRAKLLELRANRPDLAAATDAELVARARSITPYIREFFEPYYVYGTASSVGPGILGELCAGIDPSLPGRLISGIGDIDSAPPSHAMWAMSRTVVASTELTEAFNAGLEGLRSRLEQSEPGRGLLATLAEFVAEHGARGPSEWDPGSPTWEINPDVVLPAINAMRFADESLSPANRHAAAVADREAAETEARAALAGNEEALATLEMGLRVAKIFLPTRERTKLTEMMAIHEIRLPMYELGRRGVEAGALAEAKDVFLLLDDELDGYIADPQSMAATIAERKVTFAELAKLQDPFIIHRDVPPLGEWKQRDLAAEPVTVGEVLAGVPGSPGVSTGKARVITDPGDPRGLEPGEILVAPLTDPSWTPLFVPTAGVVVEVGAPLSHSVIVSREFGVPCVTGVYGAARRIPDGAVISVDGSAGTVTIVELPE